MFPQRLPPVIVTELDAATGALFAATLERESGAHRLSPTSSDARHDGPRTVRVSRAQRRRLDRPAALAAGGALVGWAGDGSGAALRRPWPCPTAKRIGFSSGRRATRTRRDPDHPPAGSRGRRDAGKSPAMDTLLGTSGCAPPTQMDLRSTAGCSTIPAARMRARGFYQGRRRRLRPAAGVMALTSRGARSRPEHPPRRGPAVREGD